MRICHINKRKLNDTHQYWSFQKCVIFKFLVHDCSIFLKSPLFIIFLKVFDFFLQKDFMEEYNIVDISKIYVYYLDKLVEENKTVECVCYLLLYRRTSIMISQCIFDMIVLCCLFLHSIQSFAYISIIMCQFIFSNELLLGMLHSFTTLHKTHSQRYTRDCKQWFS